ncbi:hypothetical protein [Ideonella livida]|uniref:Circularly permuted type 2 ATP-grasp protein n=1 Tax=Ideonella livida TaxID=2707176 RepID=A0A7C9PJR9_9BURK|nr:hypothetical protein [Ideonella livida]NDY93777.1 hypothetical protein [Ideonella livida]
MESDTCHTPVPPDDAGSVDLATALNQACHCRTLDAQRLARELEADPALAGLGERLAVSHPHLFADTVVFIGPAMQAQVHQAVAALHRVMALPGFVEQALAAAPALAQRDWGPTGAFMGYDFHLTPQGPRLIEVNTNAGGAWLNAPLARATAACCGAWCTSPTPDSGALPLPRLEAVLVDSLRAEWTRQRGPVPWRTVAVVDDAPQAQYLAPEFELARGALARAGLQAWVLDPTALRWHEGRLWAETPQGPVGVDLVYNRLTDFSLDEPAHTALRQAYEAGAVVLTPNPRAHALQADKRHLITLGQADRLAAWGASAEDLATLQAVVPQTVAVVPAVQAALWAQRRQWFFKPRSGYAAKGAYRGDKLTRRVWEEICASGDYVAQALVPPAQRVVGQAPDGSALKFDLRAYAYQGQVQLLAARLYAGQTTNFRTPGGGFAPVAVLPV